MSEDIIYPSGTAPIDANEVPVQEEVLGEEVQADAERVFAIVSVADADSINFSQFLTTSVESARKSEDGSLMLLKFVGETPSSISEINTTLYTIDEIGAVLSSPEWTPDSPIES